LARQEMSYGQRWNPNLGAAATEELPEILTGAERPSDAERRQHLQAEETRRAEELAEINAMCDGHFERASGGDKALMALRLTGRNLWNGVGETKWPQFVGNLARGLIDPRVSLMGVVSGLSMALSGVANLANMAAWRADPLGNLLKSAADIATG